MGEIQYDIDFEVLHLVNVPSWAIANVSGKNYN